MRHPVEPPRVPPPAESKWANQLAQAVLLAVVLAAPALMCLHNACVDDPDLWWHLRTGQWIMQHHAIPHADPFSGANAGKPWQPYSWLFELIAYNLFERLGLVGIVGYSTAMVLAIAVAMRHLVARLQSDFSLVALLTFIACFSFGHMFTPRPWLFTILFFVLEIDILMHARRTGKAWELVWLPVIFALWSNLHIQFVDGLAMLALAAAEAVVSQWGFRSTRLRAKWLLTALGGSIVATFANPFGWHIYRVAYDLAAQPGVLNKITELEAIPFRDVGSYCVLFLALGAAAALAWSRRFPVFETGLLIFAAVVSFRSQRDIWVVVTAAAAILASALPARDKSGHIHADAKLPGFATALVVVAAACAALTGFRVMHIDNGRLQVQVADSLPVHAVDVLRAKVEAGAVHGPLFNDFNWGGYLIWAAHMPVSVDGRAAFYGDQSLDRSIATWGADPDWNSDPQLLAAGAVIGPVKWPLTQVLRLDPRFQLVYEDKLAAVFIRK